MIEGILIGLKTALTFQNIFMVMIGCFFGTIIGMLPGLGPMTAIALMIPITYGFDPATGLILMAGVYYGAVFGGSTSSILLNAFFINEIIKIYELIGLMIITAGLIILDGRIINFIKNKFI